MNNVIPMHTTRAAVRHPVRPDRAQSDNEIATRWINSELSGYPQQIVRIACSRAHKNIRQGRCWSLAADLAVKWARCAIHDTTPPSAA